MTEGTARAGDTMSVEGYLEQGGVPTAPLDTRT